MVKIDKHFSCVVVCPKTGDDVSGYMHTNGVCKSCGHVSNSTVAHYKKLVGKWLRPSLIEWFCGQRKTFIKKELSDGKDI